jgi:hypothetical protein
LFHTTTTTAATTTTVSVVAAAIVTKIHISKSETTNKFIIIVDPHIKNSTNHPQHKYRIICIRRLLVKYIY